MAIWQKRLGNWASWWNMQIKVNPTQVYEQLRHPVVVVFPKSMSLFMRFFVTPRIFNVALRDDEFETEKAERGAEKDERINDATEGGRTIPSPLVLVKSSYKPTNRVITKSIMFD